MSGWFLSSLSASRDAAILALAIGGLLALVGRQMPVAWRHRLWLLVALRLMLPVVPASPVSWQRAIPVVEPSVPPAMTSQVPVPPVFGARPAEPEEMRTLPPPPRRTPVRWVDVLEAIWLCGAGTFAGFALFTSLRFRRRMTRLTVMGHPRAERLRAMIEEAGWSRMPQLRLTDAVSSPALTGLFRPEILMPPSVVDRLSDAEVRLVILHELGHWRRRDLWVHLGLVLLQAVHWFNPLIWWAFHRTRIEGERATDAWVLRRAGDDQAATYGETLLRLLEPGARPRPAFSGIVSVVEGPDDLRQRIVAIARFRGRRNRWAAILSGALLAGLAAVGLTQAPRVEDAGDRTRVTVTDESGKAVTGAQIWLLVPQPGRLDFDAAPREIGRTDGTGILEFPILPEWKARKDPYTFAHLFVRSEGGTRATVKRMLPFPVAAVSVEFKAGKSLRFRVLDPAGNPVPGMRLRVAHAVSPDDLESDSEELPDVWLEMPERFGGFWDAVTDPDGRCQIGPLPPGRYYVDHDDPRFAQVPGGKNARQQYNPEKDRGEIEIKLLAAAMISGFVRFPNGRSVSGAVVTCLEHYDYLQGGSSAQCRTDAEGYYQLERLLPSHYSVRVDLPNHLETDWTTDINNLTLRTGEERSWLVLELSKGSLITGKVTLADTGAPVSKIPIATTSMDSISPLYFWTAETDDLGVYRMRIPAGGRKVYVAGAPPSGYQRETADRRELSMSLNAKEGETLQVDFALPPTATIRGRVVDREGKLVVDATVFCLHPTDSGRLRRAQTGPEGRFSMDLPVGTEKAKLMATHQQKIISAVPSWFIVTEEAELQLANRFASVAGRVVDPKGKPIVGARVTWTSGEIPELTSETKTDQEGKYRIDRIVPEKRVGFWASKPGYRKTLRQADLEPGKTAEVAPIVLPLADPEE